MGRTLFSKNCACAAVSVGVPATAVAAGAAGCFAAGCGAGWGAALAAFLAGVAPCSCNASTLNTMSAVQPHLVLCISRPVWFYRSGDDALDHFAGHVGETEVA